MSKKKTPKKTTATRSPFSPRAAQTFAALPLHLQALFLWQLGQMASPKVSPSRLYATEAQRRAAKQTSDELAAERAADEKSERERMDIKRQLAALHNRAQARRAKSDYLTPAQRRRHDALYARLNVIDGNGGAR